MLLAVIAADGWRWPVLSMVDSVAGAQSLWGLGAFVFAVLLSDGRWARGVPTGACFGGVAITSYYVYEWLAYDAHAATSQLTRSGGIFWVVSAVAGGAACGLLGAWAGRAPSDHRWDPCALGWTGMAAMPLGELALVLWHASSFVPGALIIPAVTMVLLTSVLLMVGVRQAGWRRMGTAAVVVAVLAPLLGMAFIGAELRFAYLTL